MYGFTPEDRERIIETNIAVARVSQKVDDFIKETSQYIKHRNSECDEIDKHLKDITTFIDKKSSWLGGAKYIISLISIGVVAIIPQICSIFGVWPFNK